jgi:hypothetical protein
LQRSLSILLAGNNLLQFHPNFPAIKITNPALAVILAE